MTALVDITGQKFGRLAVVQRAGSIGRKASWLCHCECGAQAVVLGESLRRGATRSCGCLQREEAAERARQRCTVHGHNTQRAQSPTWHSWRAMVKRCTNPAHKSFRDYGGRGIAVDRRWLEYPNFLADMGERPAGTSLDRIDVDGNYEPGNCRWATASEQQRNKRCNRAIA